MGRYFTYDLLAAASNQQETILIQALDELWQQRVIRDQGTFLYDFSHDKIRQVAYHSASPVKRQQWHKQIIKALEAQHAAGQDVEYHQLGTHYEAVGNYHKALECYQNAAEAAQHIYAHQDVLANLARALAQTEKFKVDGVLISNLHEQRGSVLFTMGEYEKARDAWETAVSHTNNPIDHARLLRQQGEAWISQHAHAAANETYHKALQALGSAPQNPDDPLWWQTWIDVQICRCTLYYFCADLSELSSLIAHLQEPVAEHGSTEQVYQYLDSQNMLTFRQKQYRLDEQDIATTRHLLTLSRKIGNKQLIASSIFSLGFTYLWTNFLQEAIAELSTALNWAAEFGNVYLQNQCLAYLTLVYRRLGDDAHVKVQTSQHRPISAHCNNPFYQGILAGNEAWLSCRDSDWETAVIHGEAARTIWGELPFPLKWVALWPLLAAYLEQGNLMKATDCAVQMLTPPQQLLDEPITAVLQQAVHAWQTGDEMTSQKQLTTALALVQADHTF